MAFKQMSVEDIEVKKSLNFRKKFSKEDIDTLADSIERVGQLQPVVVSSDGVLNVN